MIYLNDAKTIFNFSAQNAPVLTIHTGDSITFQTKDCFSGQLTSNDDTLTELDWSITNPATGPVYVQDAKPVDTLKVTIEKSNLMIKVLLFVEKTWVHLVISLKAVRRKSFQLRIGLHIFQILFYFRLDQ